MNAALFTWGASEVAGSRPINVNFFLVSAGILLVGDYRLCHHHNITLG